ncbi:hypothetical protein [Sphingobium nicotianae]|uniref:Uncharacterized protein n=1 Tax=Sphingobium nicotianae TaxID=2782607 RepID=A0A9X1AIU3_9SPHN|nr:hypothetical protein [Sphingobium nicotianae]MBT2185545.1 hypothetical protein [Sphingobium nicotianae]
MDRRTFLTRGALIAPLAMAPAIPFEASASVVDRRVWDSTMRKWQTAKAKGHTFDMEYVDPLYEAEKAAFGRGHIYPDDPRYDEVCAWRDKRNYEAIHNRCEELADAEADAHVALLRMPAPDTAALRWKLDQTIEEDGEIALWCEEIALAIQADYRRLLPAEG